MNRRITLAVLGVLSINSINAAAAPSIEDQIQVLQQELEDLRSQLDKANTGNKANGIQGFVDRTTIGGYGDLIYNNFGGKGATAADTVDFRRFVIFLGHRFNDNISFKSELELESANTENSGVIELEQAYLDFNISEQLNVKAGVFLIPLGFLNETHEPPTFFGVERNFVETRIIPTTYSEAGVALYGEIAQSFKYQVSITTSLDASRFSPDFSNGVRDGRTNVSRAPAEDLGFTARLDYVGTPGLIVGGSVFTGNTGQDNPALPDTDARLTLWDLHSRYSSGRLDVRALYAQGNLEDADRLKTFANIDAAERFYGWFTEAAYHVWKDGDHDFAPFIRYESWDTQASVPDNVVRNAANKNAAWTIGANYWPHPQVVLKADYQTLDKQDEDRGDKRFNLGLGYLF